MAVAIAAATALPLLFSSTSPVGMVMAAPNDTTNVSVSIASEASVSVTPNLFNFSDMGLQTENFSDHSKLQLIIKNDGSTNISSVYANPDTLDSEQDNPLGSSNPEEYAAGRFLWIKNETSGFYHAGTLTWNRTEEAGGKPSGMQGLLSNTVSWGFYRNSTGDYLWELAPNSTNSGTKNGNWYFCNTSTTEDPQLRIKNVTDDGSNRDMSASATTRTYDLTTKNGDWSETFVSNGPLKDHYVAANSDCTKAYVYRFDKPNTFPTGNDNNRQYLVQPSKELSPGDEFNARVGAAIPDGIPAGTTNQTTLTIYASDAG